MGSFLRILKGDDYTYTANVVLGGVAQNVESAAEVWWTLKTDPASDADADKIAQMTKTGGGVTISNSNVTATMNSATSANLDIAPLLFWDLKLRTSSGQVYTLDQGRAAVEFTSTRATA